MKSIWRLFAVMLFLVLANAARTQIANVLVRSTDHGLNPLIERTITLTPAAPLPLVYGTNLVNNESEELTTDTNGVVTFTNRLKGDYRVEISGAPGTAFTIRVPTNATGTVNAALISVTPTASAPGLAYTTVASDARFLHPTNSPTDGYAVVATGRDSKFVELEAVGGGVSESDLTAATNANLASAVENTTVATNDVLATALAATANAINAATNSNLASANAAAANMTNSLYQTTVGLITVPDPWGPQVAVSTSFFEPLVSRQWLYPNLPCLVRPSTNNDTFRMNEDLRNTSFSILQYIFAPPNLVTGFTVRASFTANTNIARSLRAGLDDWSGNVQLAEDTILVPAYGTWTNWSKSYNITGGESNLSMVFVPRNTFGSTFNSSIIVSNLTITWDGIQPTNKSLLGSFRHYSVQSRYLESDGFNGFIAARTSPTELSRFGFVTTATNVTLDIIALWTNALTIKVYAPTGMTTYYYTVPTNKVSAYVDIPLPGGQTRVDIINSAALHPSGANKLTFQSWVRGIFVAANEKFEFVTGERNDSVWVYGDSISADAFAEGGNDNLPWPQIQYLAGLRAYIYAAGTRFFSTTWLNDKSNLLASVRITNPSRIWLAIGRNDWAFSTMGTNQFCTNYANLIDTLHAIAPRATIYAQGFIHQQSEAANTFGHTLGDWRLAWLGAISNRLGYVVPVDGPSLIGTDADLADGIHPGDVGNAKMSFLMSLQLLNYPSEAIVKPHMQGSDWHVPGNLNVLSNASVSGTVTATGFSGSGSSLTGINADNVSSGTLPLPRGGTGASLADPNANTILLWDDTDNAFKFVTLGSGLTYDHATHTISAPSGGSGDVVAANNNIFTGSSNRFVGNVGITGNAGISTLHSTNAAIFDSSVTASSFIGSGASLTGLNADQITSGEVDASHLPDTVAYVNEANRWQQAQVFPTNTPIRWPANDGGSPGDTPYFEFYRDPTANAMQLDYSGAHVFTFTPVKLTAPGAEIAGMRLGSVVMSNSLTFGVNQARTVDIGLTNLIPDFSTNAQQWSYYAATSSVVIAHWTNLIVGGSRTLFVSANNTNRFIGISTNCIMLNTNGGWARDGGILWTNQLPAAKNMVINSSIPFAATAQSNVWVAAKIQDL